MDATQAGDTERVLALMSDDVEFLVAGQPPMRKSAFAAQARRQAAPGGPTIRGDSDIQEIKVLGDWAFMWSRLKVVVSPADGSAAQTRTGHTLSVLKKEAGRWLLARDANLLSTHPPAPGAGV